MTARPSLARALLMGGKGVPDAVLASACGRLGIHIVTDDDDWAARGEPCLLVSASADGEIETGLKPPYSGVYEWRPGMPVALSDPCVEAIRQGGLAVSLSTRQAYGMELAQLFTAALAWRLDLDPAQADRIEMALQEAVANGLVHGNLEISSDPRGDADGFAAYCAMISERMVHPRLSTRHIEITARPVIGGVEIQVADQGAGYDMEAELNKVRHRDAKAGRGLNIINQLACKIEACDGGRRIVMVFA